MKAKKIFIMFLFSAALGAVIGGILWIFLRVMNLGIELLWSKIPGCFDGTPWSWLYALGLGMAGGLGIGLIQKKWGSCPALLSEVMATVRKEKFYDYHHMPRMLLAAILPLLFGGAVGPEAGLTGIFVGLCYWAGDHLKSARKILPEMADVGISATLAVLFGSPFFGFLLPIEEDLYSDREVKLPKGIKIFATFCGIFGALVLFLILGHLFGRGGGLPRFGPSDAGVKDLVWIVPLTLLGVAFGWFFKLTERGLHRLIRPLAEKQVLLGVLCGAAVGAAAIFFPWAMFSGENQMDVLIEDYALYAPAVLLVAAAVKMVMTNICISCGWRGGHFFPAIFSGVAAGFAAAAVLPVDPVFCCAVVCAAVITTILRKPFAAAMLLMLCFPVNCLLYLIGASLLAALIPDFGGKRHESA